MAEKRYYWLRLQEDFFSSIRIKKLRKIAGGDTYTIIYLKMQLLSIRNGGILKYTGIESSFAEELALDLDEDVENVQITLQYLKSCGLIETSDNFEFLLPFAAANIGTEVNSAKRVRAFRERQKALQSNTDVTDAKRLGNTELEIDKDIEGESRDIPPLTPPQGGASDAFNQFWKAYPKKVGKQAAIKAFDRVRKKGISLDTLLLAIERQKKGSRWNRDNGQYIPNPTTWLNQGRWDDEEDEEIGTDSRFGGPQDSGNQKPKREYHVKYDN